MRVKASQIAMIAALAVSAPLAYARPHRTVAKAAPVFAAVPARGHRTAAPSHAQAHAQSHIQSHIQTHGSTTHHPHPEIVASGSKKKSRAELKAEAREEARAGSGRGGGGKAGAGKKAARLRKGRHAEEEDAPELPVMSRVKGRRGRAVESAPVAAQPKKLARGGVPWPQVVPQSEPQPEDQPAQEPIHVTHDRKQHLTPEPAEGGRKATGADFMSQQPGSQPSAQTLTGISHPSMDDEQGPRLPGGQSLMLQPQGRAQGTKAPAAKPVPVVSVIRSTPEKPRVPTIEEMVVTPEVVPALFYRRGRLVMPPALKGSHEILVRQNMMADHDGLDRVQDDADLERMRRDGSLVPFPGVAGLQADERLPGNRRYTRPWTAQFLYALARAHYARFHTPLQVNSAVRTVEFQVKLQRTNGNAAPAEGETASPHLTGQAVDLAKHGLSMTEIAWLRGYLMPLVQEHKVDVEEEFQQACFHISVYRSYVPSVPVRREFAQGRRVGDSVLATALR